MAHTVTPQAAQSSCAGEGESERGESKRARCWGGRAVGLDGYNEANMQSGARKR